MPEDVMLPGIDPAPGAPAAPAAPEPAAVPAATPPADDAARTTPPADPTAGTDDGLQARPGRQQSGIQARINELTSDRHEANRRYDALMQQHMQLVRDVAAGKMGRSEAAGAMGLGTQPEAPPEPKQFDDWQKYLMAAASYQARQDLRRELAQAAESNRQRSEAITRENTARQTAEATQQLHGVLGDQMAEAMARYPDFEQVVGASRGELPVRVEAAMVISGAGGDVAYYLAKNPAVVRQLAGLPDMLLAHHINRIASHMAGGSVSSAPPPGRPGGSRGAGPMEYPKDATPEQHMAWKSRRAAAAAKGR